MQGLINKQRKYHLHLKIYTSQNTKNGLKIKYVTKNQNYNQLCVSWFISTVIFRLALYP